MSEGEAALRRRLSPEQLEDLDKTKSFCVRCTALAPPRNLYRIVVSEHYRCIVDILGQMREYYPYHIDDPWDRALAIMLDLQMSAYVERHSCRYSTSYPPPTDYGGKL